MFLIKEEYFINETINKLVIGHFIRVIYYLILALVN